MRIVVVEDNENVAKGIAYRLRDIGYAVDLLHDGNAADEFLAGDGADLAVIDINLPGLDGLSLVRKMRARGDGRPVIMLTAMAELEDRVAGLDSGADDYLAKPFQMAELEARIRALSRRLPQQITDNSRRGRSSRRPSTRASRVAASKERLPTSSIS
ncbi:MAG: response regulator transcription factor, partial [Pseudomonadota bacterium]